MPNSKSKSNPLTSPATPIALQPHHLLSPPADLLTNTATTLTITPTQDTKSPSQTFTIHRIRAHENPRQPRPHRPPLHRTRETMAEHKSRTLRHRGRPSTRTTTRLVIAEMGEGAGTVYGSVDEPPPYSAVSGVGVGREGNADTHADANANAGVTQRNEKEVHSQPAECLITSPSARHTFHPPSPSLLPSYDSVRRDSPNSLRDLLDAIESPQEPVPAVLFRSSTSTSSSQNASASTSTSSDPGIGSAHTNTEAPRSEVELRVMQLAASGTGVMMGNQKIMHITRHNAMDYSKSKARLRPRWEVEVAEGVDLLLAVNIVLIMSESSQNKWR
ncbi:hypothetical protein N7519_004036 [Penicillium mononematosum]|uniref:uncharacterized protein n=1 Tax=Penicillium mononematosum TaxID=268346 RepID=UPI0025468A3B|nr:uncharacterized protein N7519_004036 [Penicillium mononematosum]KAJ6189128.1 hypothetical protein N7519_004036 [Penicillium mononematosum]